MRAGIFATPRPEPGHLLPALAGGVPVRFGDATAVAIKGQSLAAIVSWGKRTGVRPAAIDVSAPGAPALTPAAASPHGERP